MRGNPAEHEIVCPVTLADALALFRDQPGVWKPLAGGTDLLVQYEAGDLKPAKFVGLWRYPELKALRVTPSHIEIGALATYTEVRENPLIAAEFPNLARAAHETGGIAIQNRGTVGGNIANASPAADMPPSLLSYDAEVELLSAAGTRRVALANFYTGYKKTVMTPGEIIRAVHVKRVAGRRHFYRKVGTRNAQAISKVVIAMCATKEGNKITGVRIALGSVGPVTLRAKNAEAALEGKIVDAVSIAAARTALMADISPIDDIRSTGAFRAGVAQNVLVAFLQELG